MDSRYHTIEGAQRRVNLDFLAIKYMLHLVQCQTETASWLEPRLFIYYELSNTYDCKQVNQHDKGKTAFSL